MSCFRNIRKSKNVHLFQTNSRCFVSSVLLLLFLTLLSLNYSSSYKNALSLSIGVLKITPKPEQNKTVKPHVVKIDPCLGKYIYMYNLPSRFNTDLVKNCRAIAQWFNYCPYMVNGGFGPRFSNISEDSETFSTRESWYETNQFMLSMIFHDRLKKYECLTKNSSLATAIYAPFYGGLDIRKYLDESNLTIRDESALAFTSWLTGRPEWKRVRGWDHFFVFGRISWDFRRLSNYPSGWGSKLMNLPETRNTTVLLIESSPWANNDFAIPYPTYFHPKTDNEVFEWQTQVKNAKRSYLFAFGGASRPNSTSIRDELIRQCRNSSRNRCNLINCKEGDEMCTKPAYFVKMYLRTKFCLQPPGDSSTRRSAFDSILAGCIPVFFHPASAYVQYMWHFPKNYPKYSVFIPYEGVKNGSISVEKILSGYSEDDIAGMREEVIRLIPRTIYARNKLETIEDGFDISIKRILERIQENTKLVRKGIDPNSRFPEDKSWKYYLTGGVGNHEWDSYL